MSNRQNQFFTLVLPLILYCALIYYISSLPSPPTPDLGFDWGDKVTHAGAFGVMGLLAIRGARWFGDGGGGVRSLVRWIILGVIFCTIYGALDEVHQSFVPGRDADVMDWVADTVGALLAGGFVWVASRTRWGRAAFNPGV